MNPSKRKRLAQQAAMFIKLKKSGKYDPTRLKKVPTAYHSIPIPKALKPFLEGFTHIPKGFLPLDVGFKKPKKKKMTKEQALKKLSKQLHWSVKK